MTSRMFTLSTLILLTAACSSYARKPDSFSAVHAPIAVGTEMQFEQQISFENSSDVPAVVIIKSIDKKCEISQDVKSRTRTVLEPGNTLVCINVVNWEETDLYYFKGPGGLTVRLDCNKKNVDIADVEAAWSHSNRYGPQKGVRLKNKVLHVQPINYQQNVEQGTEVEL